MVATLEAFISPWLAAASCLAFAIIFVGSLFVFPLDDPARKRAKLLERLEREELQQQQQQQQEQQHQSPQPQQQQQLQQQHSSPSLSTPPLPQQQQPQKRSSQDRRSEDHQYALPGVNGYIPVATTSTGSASSGTSTSKSNGLPKSALSGAGHRLSAQSPRIVSSSSMSSSTSSSSQLEAHFDRYSLNQPHHHHHYHHHTHYHHHHHGGSSSYPYQNSPPIPVPQPRLDRDHPLVIKRRFKGILLTSVIVPIYLWFVFSTSGAIPTDQSFGTRLGQFFAFIGLALPGNLLKLLNHLILPLLLVMVLFAGPLLMMFLSKELPFQQAFDWRSQRKSLLGWVALRNYIVGPLAEEFIFRGCMVAITAISGATKSAMVFGLPMVFGVAHIHHAYESYTKNNRTRQALLNALAVSLFQLFYTTVFGWFATYCFVRTSNVLGPTLAHAFCNLMGFPDVTNIQYFGRWKYALYLTFVLGMVAFGLLLNPLTHPALYDDAGVSPYWLLTMGDVVVPSPSAAGAGDGGAHGSVAGAVAAANERGLKKVVQSVKEAVKTAMTHHQQR
ncbi:hypothetical protein BGZ73_002990 [Actinomortierella ambigua]|nr:hypothetical protein BGZ73_002990 [Actinomortierella ambigua]